MSSIFDTEADFDSRPHLSAHSGCSCAFHQRRLFGAALIGLGATAAIPAWAQVEVDERSAASNLVPAGQLEEAATQQYRKMLQEAAQQKALAPSSNAQLQRIRAIAQRLIPFVNAPNLKSTPRAAQWNWEINLFGSKQVNAFCMPGGKIGVYYGLLTELRTTDDEVAIVMGHEIAHALREHARERMGKGMATNAAIEIGSAIFGLGNVGRTVAGMGGQLLSLSFSRADESEADKVGLDLAARGGYNPEAGVTLWKKMVANSAGAGSPPWLSTHPAGPDRIRQIEALLPQVMPLYERAPKPTQRFEPASPRPGNAEPARR